MLDNVGKRQKITLSTFVLLLVQPPFYIEIIVYVIPNKDVHIYIYTKILKK